MAQRPQLATRQDLSFRITLVIETNSILGVWATPTTEARKLDEEDAQHFASQITDHAYQPTEIKCSRNFRSFTSALIKGDLQIVDNSNEQYYSDSPDYKKYGNGSAAKYFFYTDGATCPIDSKSGGHSKGFYCSQDHASLQSDRRSDSFEFCINLCRPPSRAR